MTSIDESQSKTPPKYLAAEERRAMTVQTVLSLAAENNPADITTTAIAARMGLSQGALFRHYPTKDDLWQAVMEYVSQELSSRVLHAAGSTAAPLDALRAMFMAHVDFALEHPGVPRLLFSELQRPGATPAKTTLRSMMGAYRERLVGLVVLAQEQGVATKNSAPEMVATLFVGVIQGLIVQSFLVDDMDHVRRAAPGALEFFFAGHAGRG